MQIAVALILTRISKEHYISPVLASLQNSERNIKSVSSPKNTLNVRHHPILTGHSIILPKWNTDLLSFPLSVRNLSLVAYYYFKFLSLSLSFCAPSLSTGPLASGVVDQIGSVSAASSVWPPTLSWESGSTSKRLFFLALCPQCLLWVEKMAYNSVVQTWTTPDLTCHVKCPEITLAW